jgi:glyoxylase-like metal-dependent hydrolase (beta-lactamase superfamily II)
MSSTPVTPPAARPVLPKGITIFERGWLSSNNILLSSPEASALVDSGYVSHSEQTLALVDDALDGETLDVLVNTHLHSDHCGGNAAFQQAYPGMTTFIPPGHSEHVSQWDPYALTYAPTGQSCPQFRFDAVLVPGSEIRLGGRQWQIHTAPGHDPHSVILFEPEQRILISADALWERGFGVVFPELEGLDAYAAVGDTLTLIESLEPRIVIPGHGSAFSHAAESIAFARERLDAFVRNPEKHIRYAAKVLLKFKLLEVQSVKRTAFVAWAAATPYFKLIFDQRYPGEDFSLWINQLIDELVRSGAAAQREEMIANAG